jgi:glycerol-3-phosphate dehydrogenase
MNTSLASNRSVTLRALTSEPLDILIVGGGIVGAGIARDAALRGLKIGLVEQHDFAFGTSSRSSRLLHGGLRYLAQGRIGLVHEASVEKKIVHHIAPHLAAPLPFIFPTYRGNKNWVLWQLQIGVKIYDLLCRGRNLGKSTWLSPGAVGARVPALTQTNLNGAVRYYDGFTNDARLVLDNLRSAARAGATLLNYARFNNAWQVGDLWECAVTDELNSAARSRRREEAELTDATTNPPADVGGYTIRARAVVNATGPWADGLAHSQVKLRVTKGIHAVVEHYRVPVPDTVVMTEGKRILFAIPWGERTILGTTDTDYSGPLDQVHAAASDLNYVLGITNQFFPKAKLETKDVISTWAGLRPLIADPNGKPSDISRSHEITNPQPGWWDVAGGKLTTYRLMAEQAVDKIVKTLKPSQREASACRTATEPLLPPAEVRDISGILPPPFTQKVVVHFVTNEWAVHLDDVMLRRTSWHYYHRDAAGKAEQVSRWMAELLDWTESERNAELARYRRATGQAASVPVPEAVTA